MKTFKGREVFTRVTVKERDRYTQLSTGQYKERQENNE